MQLKPLEFSECLSDSPFFRQSLHHHEIALEQTSKKIKEVEQHCRKILSYTNKLSQAQKQLAEALSDFKIGMIGTASEDDLVLANYTKDMANLIILIEDQRTKTIQETERLYLSPLQNLVEKINHVRDERQKYSKESGKFYQALERNLNLKVTTVKKSDFREGDAQLALQQRSFCQASLNYVSEIQTVQESVRIEFIQTISSFLYQWLLFYHMANAIHQDFRFTYNEINHKLQKAKENFEVQQVEADELRRKMLLGFMRNTVFQSEAAGGTGTVESDLAGTALAAGAIAATNNSTIKQGYLFMHEKSLLPKTISRDVLSRSTWTKYYCVYSRETKIFTLIPPTNLVKTDTKGGWIGHTISFKKLDCSKRAPDSIDKRFCFDVLPENKAEVFTFQALSEIDCAQWLEAMDGREPDYGPASLASTSSTMLDEAGFEFIRQCIHVIEEKGIKEQGLYRNCGVNSKVQKLMQNALDRRKAGGTNALEKLSSNIGDPEWEIKTISSAIKTFLRNLPEPLMTFELHQNFINAAKLHNSAQRVQHIHYWVHRLPNTQKSMLEMVVRHLRRVADHSADNLMSVGNLAVCFGPTLLRPREETMAAVLDIKFCNVVVEALVEHCQLIFGTSPPQKIEPPCPPKPAKNQPPQLQAPPMVDDEEANTAICSSRSSEELNCSSLNEINIQGAPSRVDATADFVLSSLQRFGTTPRPIAGSTQNFLHDGSVPNARQQQQRAPGRDLGKQIESRSDLCLPSSAASTDHYSSSRPTKSTVVGTEGVPVPQQQQRAERMVVEIESPASSSSSIDCQKSASTGLRGKSTGPYATSYNPAAFESASNYATLRGPLKRGDSSGSTQQKFMDPIGLTMRIPPAYSNFINPNGPLHPPRRVRTLYPCAAGHETELSFDAGQIITNVYESKEEGWLVGTLNGKTGLIPANYVSYVDNF